jgi:hypothetical protein
VGVISTEDLLEKLERMNSTVECLSQGDVLERLWCVEMDERRFSLQQN